MDYSTNGELSKQSMCSSITGQSIEKKNKSYVIQQTTIRKKWLCREHMGKSWKFTFESKSEHVRLHFHGISSNFLFQLGYPIFVWDKQHPHLKVETENRK